MSIPNYSVILLRHDKRLGKQTCCLNQYRLCTLNSAVTLFNFMALAKYVLALLIFDPVFLVRLYDSEVKTEFVDPFKLLRMTHES